MPRMSSTAALDETEITDPKSRPIEFPFPAEVVFTPREITLTVTDPSNKKLPNFLPRNFKIAPQVENGNIQFMVQDVRYFNQPDHPTVWTVQNASKNATGDIAQDSVSVVLVDSLSNLLALTGNANKRIWQGRFTEGQVTTDVSGEWSVETKGKYNSFCERFSWTFLLAFPSATPAPGDPPLTVILEFELDVRKNGILRQLSSFPAGWKVTQIGDFSHNGGLFFRLEAPGSELYNLKNGLFVGAFGALVCQGVVQEDSAGQEEMVAIANPGDGTWTGTSGGPLA